MYCCYVYRTPHSASYARLCRRTAVQNYTRNGPAGCSLRSLRNSTRHARSDAMRKLTNFPNFWNLCWKQYIRNMKMEIICWRARRGTERTFKNDFGNVFGLQEWDVYLRQDDVTNTSHRTTRAQGTHAQYVRIPTLTTPTYNIEWLSDKSGKVADSPTVTDPISTVPSLRNRLRGRLNSRRHPAALVVHVHRWGHSVVKPPKILPAGSALA